MKKHRNALLVAVVSAALGAGCSTLQVSHVSSLDSTPNGVRVYAPRILLLVDGHAKPTPQTQIVTLPDPCRAYDVKPLTILAKQDFKIELDDGAQLKALTSNQDTTAFLTFLSGAANLAARAAGFPVGVQTITGSFGLADGVYSYSDAGGLLKLYDAESRPTATSALTCASR
jgi:hypothetical protein